MGGRIGGNNTGLNVSVWLIQTANVQQSGAYAGATRFSTAFECDCVERLLLGELESEQTIRRHVHDVASAFQVAAYEVRDFRIVLYY